MRAAVARCNTEASPPAERRREVGALPPIDVVAGERVRQASVRQRLAGQELPQRQPAAVEGVRGPRHVDAPDAEALLAHFLARRFGVRLEAIDPMPQRLAVVLAQRLGVDEL